MPAVLAIAWGGAALFVLSLAFFLYSYAFTFAEIAIGPARPSAITANFTLFTVFALHHSVFARERVRAAVARSVPAPLERSVYVYVASALFIGVCAFWQPVPGVAWQLGGIAAIPLYALQLWGIWLSLRSAAIIDIWELAGVKQASTPNFQRPTSNGESPATWELGVGSWKFKTNGPYGWVRHPIYSGWFLIVFAATPMTMTRLVFAVISGIYVLIAIPFEERSLRRTAGAAYAEYMRQVKWKLVPGVY